ncbi:MAG: hypothetical protein ACYC6Y_15555, partial [Thermoguttaceae bacterium]
MMRTRQQLLEHFDDEVREKLRIHDERSRSCLNRYEQLLMRLTRYELADFAEFDGDSAFILCKSPFNGDIPLGRYELPRRSGDAHLYRLGHPLAQRIVERAKGRELPSAEIVFDLTDYPGRVSSLEPYVGEGGTLRAIEMTVEALDVAEEYLIVAAVTDAGEGLEEDVARRLLSLPAREVLELSEGCDDVRAAELAGTRKEVIRQAISQRNARFFEAEAEKLDGWADDLKVGLEREIKEIDRQIKEARRSATAALTLEEKLAGQKQIKNLEQHRNGKRRSLFDAQDEIDRRRTSLIEEIEAKLQQRVTEKSLFIVRWRLV